MNSVEQVAKGDLTANIEVTSQDEIGHHWPVIGTLSTGAGTQAGLVMAAKAVEKPACSCACECPTRGAEAPEPEPLTAADLAPVAMLDA